RAAVLTPPECDLATSVRIDPAPTDQPRCGVPYPAAGAKARLERDHANAIERCESRHADLAGGTEGSQPGGGIARERQVASEHANQGRGREVELLRVVDEHVLEDLALCLTRARRIADEVAGVLGCGV